MTNDDQAADRRASQPATPDQPAHDEREASSGSGLDSQPDAEIAWPSFERIHELLSTLIAEARSAAPPVPPDERVLAEFGALTERLYAMTPDQMRAARARRRRLREAARHEKLRAAFSRSGAQLAPDRPDATATVAEQPAHPSARDRAAAILAALLIDDSEVHPPTPDEEREVTEAVDRFRSIDRDVLIDRAVRMCRALDLAPSQDDRRSIAESIDHHCSMDSRALAKRFLRLRRVLGVVPSAAEMEDAFRFAESLVSLSRISARPNDDHAGTAADRQLHRARRPTAEA